MLLEEGSDQPVVKIGDVNSLPPRFLFFSFFSNTPDVLIVFVQDKGSGEPAAKRGTVIGMPPLFFPFFSNIPNVLKVFMQK